MVLWPRIAAGATVAITAGLVVVLAGRMTNGPDGAALYQEHCASCHGKNLEGQPDWKVLLPTGRLPAPPHDARGHSWHHADDLLFRITKFGMKPFAGEDYKSDMLAFEGVLSDAEIEVVIAYIKGTWPEKQRLYQEEITRQAAE